ncbi:MAG: hypothetical protein ABII00_00700 [Elusimicrobiota bacterium]
MGKKSLLLLAGTCAGLGVLVTYWPLTGALIAYITALGAGCAAIISVWVLNGMRAPYGMSDSAFLILGCVVPVSQMVFSITMPALCWLAPLCLGLLYVHGRTMAKNWRRGHERIRERELADADAAIAADPKNASAYCLKARAGEEAGMYDLAIANYRKARDLDTRAYTEAACAHDEKRLLALIEERLAADDGKGSGAGGAVPALGWGWLIALLYLAPFAVWDVRRFVAAYSVWLFALWLLRLTRTKET